MSLLTELGLLLDMAGYKDAAPTALRLDRTDEQHRQRPGSAWPVGLEIDNACVPYQELGSAKIIRWNMLEYAGIS